MCLNFLFCLLKVKNGDLVIVINGQEYIPISDSFKAVEPVPEPLVTSTTVIVIAVLVTIVVVVIIIAATLVRFKTWVKYRVVNN